MTTPLKQVVYRDLDFRFEIHPVNKRLKMVDNTDAIKQAVENLVLLDKYEGLFQPNLQTNLRGSLFDNLDSGDILIFKTIISDAIRSYEPRASVISIDIRDSVADNLDNNKFYVTIKFLPENQLLPVTINTFIKKIR